MSARSVECQCSPSLTCAYCCRNAKPWHYTVTETIARVTRPKGKA